MNSMTETATRNSALAAHSNRAWTGSRMIDVLNPSPDDMILSEIATGLSREVRYGGAATIVPWTVAQHSLLCDHLAEADTISDPTLRLVLLLHDAPEYMLRDLISPVKHQLPDYQDLESIWWKAVTRKFRLPETIMPTVKHYDMVAASSEKAALISPYSGDWLGLPPPRPIPAKILGITAKCAALTFQQKVEALLARIENPNH